MIYRNVRFTLRNETVVLVIRSSNVYNNPFEINLQQAWANVEFNDFELIITRSLFDLVHGQSRFYAVHELTLIEQHCLHTVQATEIQLSRMDHDSITSLVYNIL